MQGIVSLLESKYIEKIIGIQESLGKLFNENWSKKLFFPHFSWHVAEDYQQDKIETKIIEIASSIKSFNVKTAGLGIFTGQNPVLYLSLVQTHELLRLHKQLWNEFNKLARNSIDYYQPNSWVPHISLAYGNSFSNCIDKVMKELSNEDFKWEINVDNISFIDATDDNNWKMKYRSTLRI